MIGAHDLPSGAESAARKNDAWSECRFASASILPVQSACDLECPFCFSKSSISALDRERLDLGKLDLDHYFSFTKSRGATRLVITGGGEPLLRAEVTLELIRRGKQYFDEVTLFTNGTRLTPHLADELAGAGLSYICWSRHSEDDTENRSLMGARAPALAQFFQATHAAKLKVRATCVMATNYVADRARAQRYIERLAEFGVEEFTFKHTYVAYAGSLFKGSGEDRWARAHQVDRDPFTGEGEVLAALPWGPEIRNIGGLRVCYYYEPTPAWEKEHRLCRSANLLSDGRVYASLEDERSLLYRLIV
jgi:pyruvate-formate lyase-activating enzyme